LEEWKQLFVYKKYHLLGEIFQHFQKFDICVRLRQI